MDSSNSRRRFIKQSALFSCGVGTWMFERRSTEDAGQPVYNILDFGAQGDGQTDDAAAIQKAIDQCTTRGGGTVLVPGGGTFLTGSFELKSNVNLHIGSGAEIRAHPDPGHYRSKVFIRALDAENISLTGRGTINGQGRRFMERELDHIYRPKSWRPGLMVLEHCRNVRLQDLTLRDSAWWTVHLAGCSNVAVQGLSILNDRKIPNCDGVAVNTSKNVRISDCHIEAGDDCIVLKTLERFAQYGNCENVTVTGCTLASTSAALKIGTETVNDIRNVVFSSCVVRASNRGLGVVLRDGGTIENILFSDMTIETRFFHRDWWGAAEPIYVTAMPRAAGHSVGSVRNVRFSNVLCRSENGVFLRGSEESKPEGILLQGVKVRVEKWSDVSGGRYDVRPVEGREGVYEHPTAGVYGEKVRRLTLDQCNVTWGEECPAYFRHALEVHDVNGLKKLRFEGRSAHPDRYAAQLIG